jgi:hypothetical protein
MVSRHIQNKENESGGVEALSKEVQGQVIHLSTFSTINSIYIFLNKFIK